jgi:hypothetical protein
MEQHVSPAWTPCTFLQVSSGFRSGSGFGFRSGSGFGFSQLSQVGSDIGSGGAAASTT